MIRSDYECKFALTRNLHMPLFGSPNAPSPTNVVKCVPDWIGSHQQTSSDPQINPAKGP